MANDTTAHLRWGILGTGQIAQVFAQGIAASTTGVLVAVGSRTKDTAERFGEAYGVPAGACYASYEAMLADPEVQAVYISLPNHLHAEWTIACAAAGKHILCEKPLTVNYSEAMTVVEAVRAAGMFLMEAFMYRCHPQTARLHELLAAGTIGEIRLIQSNFSYDMGPDYTNIRLSNPAAGGGIMDVGCYTASLCRFIAGSEPDEVKGTAVIGQISRVDERATASLRFANGIVATMACGTQVEVEWDARIWGSAGSIQVPNPWKPDEGQNTIIVRRTGMPEQTITVTGGLPLYAIEADTVAQAIARGQTESPAMSWEDSLENMRVLDAWRRSVNLVFEGER